MSIKKNPDGTWLSDFQVRGQRYRISHASRDEARDFEYRMKFGLVTNHSDTGMPIHEALKQYSEIELKKKVSKSDEKSFLNSFYDYLSDELELYFLNDVKLIHLDRYQTFLRDGYAREKLWQKIEGARKKEAAKKGEPYTPKKKSAPKALSASSVNRHFSVIGDFFYHAKKWEWIPSNPCAEIESLPESPNARKPWESDEDVQLAIDNAAAWAAPVFFLIAHTGIRPVAAKRLSWPDIDMKGRKFKVKSLKGDGTLREHWIPMNDELHEFFETIRKASKDQKVALKYSKLVFHSPQGLPLDTKALAREMKRVTTLIGLEGFTLYGFRHKFVTDVANASEDGEYHGNLEAARILAGHASIRQTQAYNHTSDRMVRAELSKVQKTRKIKYKGVGKAAK